MKTSRKWHRVNVVTICALVAARAVLATSLSDGDFAHLYEYYFPKNGESVNSSIYRPFFDRVLAEPPLSKEYRNSQRQFYYAVRGDRDAMQKFLHAADRGGKGEFSEGEFSEDWDYECLFLLLRLGDERFSQFVIQEDKRTRERVGHAIDYQVTWTKHNFPKTRALYSYRYKRS